MSQATSWRWPWLKKVRCVEVVGIVGEKSLRKISWTRRIHPWRLLAGVCELREEGRSSGVADSRWIAFRPGGSHAKKRLFRRNSQLSLLTLRSVRLQLLSPLSLPRITTYRTPNRCLKFSTAKESSSDRVRRRPYEQCFEAIRPAIEQFNMP